MCVCVRVLLTKATNTQKFIYINVFIFFFFESQSKYNFCEIHSSFFISHHSFYGDYIYLGKSVFCSERVKTQNRNTIIAYRCVDTLKSQFSRIIIFYHRLAHFLLYVKNFYVIIFVYGCGCVCGCVC